MKTLVLAAAVALAAVSTAIAETRPPEPRIRPVKDCLDHALKDFTVSHGQIPSNDHRFKYEAQFLLKSKVCIAETPRENAARHGDLFIPYGPQPPTAAQLRADPKLRRYPGLTPLEHDTPNQHLGPDKPAPKSVCYSAWNGYSSSTVCY